MINKKTPGEILKERLVSIEVKDTISPKKFNVDEFKRLASEVRDTFKDEDFLRQESHI
jgi:hypothetical protein